MAAGREQRTAKERSGTHHRLLDLVVDGDHAGPGGAARDKTREARETEEPLPKDGRIGPPAEPARRPGMPRLLFYLLSSLTETTSPPRREEKKEMEKLCSWYTATSIAVWYMSVLIAARAPSDWGH